MELPQPANAPALTKLRELSALIHYVQGASECKVSVAKRNALFEESHRVRVCTNRDALLDKLLCAMDLGALIIGQKLHFYAGGTWGCGCSSHGRHSEEPERLVYMRSFNAGLQLHLRK